MKELTLAAITTVEAANRFIREVYIPAHNTRFAVKAAQEGAAFVVIPGVDLNEILCEQEKPRLARTIPWRSIVCAYKSRPARYAPTSSNPG